MTTSGVAPDRGGAWPVPFKAHERLILTQQAKFDRRHIPLLWYWRLLRDDAIAPEDAGTGGGAAMELMFEQPRAAGRYADPVGVHLYVDWTPEKKSKKKAVTETGGAVPIAISRAEARRLGELFQTRDDAEGLVGDDKREDFVFIPRPQDVFLARGRYYEVAQVSPQWLGATDVTTLWKGTAAMLRDDSSAPGLRGLKPPPAARPTPTTGGYPDGSR